MRVDVLILKAFWALNLIGSALVIWRLYSLDLHRIYRYFFASMAVGLARSAILFPFSPIDKIYYHIWISTQPLIWLTYILVVFELYSFVLQQYRGIYSLGRWFFFGALGVSLLITALTVVPTIQVASSTARASGRPPLLVFYALTERGTETVLAVLLLLLMVFVAGFAVPLSRNLLVHCVVYTSYFFVNNISVLFWSSGSGKNSAPYWSGVARLAVAAGCYGAWAFLLSRRGEDRITSLRLGRNAVAEKRLLVQLEDLNATLLGAARK
jgi:hypothetical protein